MKALKEYGNDPMRHLDAIMKNAGTRVFAYTTPNSRNKKAGASPNDIPKLNSLFVKTSEAILLALKSGKLSTDNVSKDFFDSLLSNLMKLGDAVFSAE